MATTKTYLRNDTGNAKRFADAFKNRVIYDSLRKRWLIFNGVTWEDDADGEIMRLAIELTDRCYDNATSKTARNFFSDSQSKPRLNALVSIAATNKSLTTSGDSWNKYPMLLPCANGAIDLETGKLIQTKPSHLLNMRTLVAYDPKAEKPERWLRFLEETWPDEDVRTYIWRALGYSLTGNVDEQAYFAMYGEGSNGKSRFINVLKAMLGDFAHTMRFTALEHSKRGGFSNDIVEISGKRFLVASETNENVRLNEGLIKSITGGDDIIARQLYERNIVFLPESKLWLAFNHKPIITDQTPGFWRRTNLVLMPTQYSVNDGADGLPLPDKKLLPKLLAELPEILRWAVEGCLEWQRDGLRSPESVRKATAQYRAENHPLFDFIRSKYEREDGEFEPREDVYRSYLKYCETYREKPMKQFEFNKEMEGLGFKKDRATRNKVHVWRGIKRRDDNWDDADFVVNDVQ